LPGAARGPLDHFGFGSIFGEPLRHLPNEVAVPVACDDLKSRKCAFGWGAYTCTQIHNVAGTPAMSAPLGMSHEGLPIGSQFAAAKGREDLL
jgi:Asp-tRNA(Asn)/Glu-tRNA(Gln) amidotransferase A subunit family amidase